MNRPWNGPSMVTPIVMPRYGQQQDEGTVVRWQKQEGDAVEIGDVLVEVETDKASFEYEAPAAGVLRKILAREGATVPVLSVIAVLTDSADEPFDMDSLPPTLSSDAATADDAGSSALRPSEGPGVKRAAASVRSSPVAKKLARTLGVDLTMVKGTGPGGRIVREDVEKAAAGGEPAARERVAGKTLSRMRQAIGRQMSFSKKTIPHFYVCIEIDMTDAEDWRRQVAANRGVKLSVTDLLVKAVAVTLAKFPALNASIGDDGTVIEHADVNIGLAVGLEEGLLVPAIGSAGEKSLRALAEERSRIVAAARDGKLQGAARTTITLSNLGMFGVTSFISIVNPPECAGLAVGAILDRVVPHGDPPVQVVRQVVEVSLSADHRMVDGMLAARFLQELKQVLENVALLERWL